MHIFLSQTCTKGFGEPFIVRKTTNQDEHDHLVHVIHMKNEQKRTQYMLFPGPGTPLMIISNKEHLPSTWKWTLDSVPTLLEEINNPVKEHPTVTDVIKLTQRDLTTHGRSISSKALLKLPLPI